MNGELRIISGQHRDQSFSLQPQATSIGRSPDADIILHWDPFVAPLHCRIDIQEDAVIITDLHSANGVRVNDQRITGSQRITIGDDIQIGMTTLRLVPITQPTNVAPIAIPPTIPTNTHVDSNPQPIVDTTPPPASSSSPDDSKPTFDIHHAKTFYASDVTFPKNAIRKLQALFDDIVRFEGELTDDVRAYHVLATFSHALPEPMFVIDFSRLKEFDRPSDDGSSSILFDWLPTPTALQLPCLYSLSELPRWKSLLEDHWGEDGFLILVSKYPKGKTLEILRDSLRSKPQEPTTPEQPSENQAANAHCWPSILCRLIEMNVEGFGRNFLSHFEFLLSENPAEPSQWSLYGPKKLLGKTGY